MTKSLISGDQLIISNFVLSSELLQEHLCHPSVSESQRRRPSARAETSTEPNSAGKMQHKYAVISPLQ